MPKHTKKLVASNKVPVTLAELRKRAPQEIQEHIERLKYNIANGKDERLRTTNLKTLSELLVNVAKMPPTLEERAEQIREHANTLNGRGPTINVNFDGAFGEDEDE